MPFSDATRRRDAGKAPRRVASVDIGTNTILLLVAEAMPSGDLRRVADLCRFARLGQGVEGRKELGSDAIARSLEILTEYREIARREGAERIAAVGTQALREAQNASEFLEPARARLGAKVEVITGEREAALVFAAVRASMPASPTDAPLVVADVGGGSTEIIVGEPGGAVTSFSSLPIGAVRLTERHLRSDPPRDDEVRTLTADIDDALSARPIPDGARLVATAGTATTLAAVSRALQEYDPDAIDGTVLAAADIDRELERLVGLSTDERRGLPGMQPERADVIAAGAAIFARLVHRAGASSMTVSDRGVRWGLAHELADEP